MIDAHEWYHNGLQQGAKEERERIIKIIDDMDNAHMTHSEKCLKMHWFAEKLSLKIQEDTNE